MRATRFKRLLMNAGLMPLTLLPLLFFFAQSAASADTNPKGIDTPQILAAIIAGKQNPLLSNPDFTEEYEQLNNLYRMNGNQLLWLGKTRSQSTIDTALSLLANADADGLNPQNYDAETLRQNFQSAKAMSEDEIKKLSEIDTALSIALLRFINDLHHGRVNPQQLSHPSQFGNKRTLDSASLIKQGIEHQSLAQIPKNAAPQLRQYRQLKQALANYRKLPKESNFQPLVFPKSLHPGDQHPQIAQLRERLIKLEVLSPQTTAPDPGENSYSEDLQEAVKTFQDQNGLQADGVIGRETAARLNQTLSQKIRQIELAMERLRWLPDDITGPMIIVNIPAFQLWALKSSEDTDMLHMKVIVGQAGKTQTPMLFEKMEYLEFMPYWNIPKSILDKEILPRLYNDLSYLENQDIELVQRHADQQEEAWDTLFDDLQSGRIRARQRPGKKNPLGKVKFVFPNKEDVYLHDTSSPSLFNRNQRDLSHGCVRVADAGKLAAFVLSNQPEPHWDETAIQRAMSGGKTQRVELKTPIPVLFFYTTTFVDQDDRVHFYRDIYQQDPLLEKALTKTDKHQGNSVLTAKTSTPG